MKENKENYLKLYDKVVEYNKNHKKLTICPSIKGQYYDTCNNKIMVVGRAINSWCPIEGSLGENETIIERLERCERCTLDWVKGKNKWMYCNANNCPYAKDKQEDGKKNITQFWRLVIHICEKNNISDEDWYKNIVWTNLYKASYQEGGNPSNGFCASQKDVCNSILINEIEEYKPQKIYFITETNGREERNWFCKKDFGEVYKKLENSGIEVFVLTRPEGHKIEKIYNSKQDIYGNITKDSNEN